MSFVTTTSLTILLFIFAGYICYKMGKAESWEKGISKVFNAIYKFVSEGLNGTSYIPPEEAIDVRCCLSPEELLELTRQLENIYDEIQIGNGIYYDNGISWYDYSAFNINKKYAELNLADREKLIRSIIRKYFQEIHGILDVPIYIRVCSNYRLYFAIPLNLVGKEYLDAQEKFKRFSEQEFMTEQSSKIIVEEIPEDDYRI